MVMTDSTLPIPAAELDRPKLTMPDDEAGAVRDAFSQAGVILEYGSGGSTVMAAEMTGKCVFSVESDRDWLNQMQLWFEANPPAADLTLHHADIGPTKSWGYPQGNEGLRLWPGYAISVWDRPNFLHPDVVLIDGRFRQACFLTTIFRIQRPVTVLWDDYVPRSAYHRIEQFFRPSRHVGRMAIFNVEPTPIPADRLGLIVETYLRPF